MVTAAVPDPDVRSERGRGGGERAREPTTGVAGGRSEAEPAVKRPRLETGTAGVAGGRSEAEPAVKRPRLETGTAAIPLPRRRLAEPHQWPAGPAGPMRPPVEECSEGTLMRILRALR
jgi:hypothetical protein